MRHHQWSDWCSSQEFGTHNPQHKEIRYLERECWALRIEGTCAPRPDGQGDSHGLEGLCSSGGLRAIIFV